MENGTDEDNLSIEALRSDALMRLEWAKIVGFLSEYATLQHSKKKLYELTPWIDFAERDFYFAATGETLLLNSFGYSLILDQFDFESFEKPLQRSSILAGFSLYQIYIVLKLSSVLPNIFKQESLKNKSFPNLISLCSELRTHSFLFQKLKMSIDPEGQILSSASPELAAARKKLESSKRKIEEYLEEFIKKKHIKDALQDTVWMIRDGRYVLPVRTDRKGDVTGTPRGVSQTGSTLFIEPYELSQQQSGLEKAQVEVQLEEQKVLKELSKECWKVSEDILASCHALVQLDEISARAQLAAAISGTQPIFLPSEERGIRFSLLKAKHPLFLLENKKCVENDLELSKKAGSNVVPFVWVLSGPNAGGKTVAMKTVGLSVLMAKAGLYVAAERAEFLNYENVFVELGDRQNREEDLSSFSGHLAQIKKITEKVNAASLVLLDEGFVGTDPAIGVAMARATLETLAEKEATVIITTHFSSLKTLANGDARFFNGSMEFEPKKLLPTYKVLQGIPGQSYAIELAERMGVEHKIIEKTRKYYSSEAQRMENILRELQEKNSEIKQEHQKQADLTQKLEQEFESLTHEREKLADLQDTLCVTYQNKLQKRLNAFENRLEIRERQFEKHKSHLLAQMQEEASAIESEAEQHSEAHSPIERSHHHQNPVQTLKQSKKSGKEPLRLKDLAGMHFPNKSSSSYPGEHSEDKFEKFRSPKFMSSRSLLDEANESSRSIKKSFDKIQRELDFELSTLDEEGMQKFEATQSRGQEIHTKQKPPEFWTIGMSVRCAKFREVGVVLQAASHKGVVECRFGSLRIRILHSELSPSE